MFRAGRLRFKVGDRVRCVDPENPHGYELRAGAVYLVEAVDADNRVKLSCYPGMWFGGDRFVFQEDEKPQFNVGDKVRCINDCGAVLLEGQEYIVSDTGDGGWIRVGGPYTYSPERFVLVTEASQKPKLMLVGPSRCGKDEAGQFLQSITGLRFAGTTSKYLSPYVARCLGMNEEECYAKRHEMREAWYHVGRAVRSGDPGILVRESLKHGEIIGGVRDREEVIAARELVSLIVWIDNERPEKDPTLMFGPECCDIIIPNNGTLEEYHERLTRFAAALGIKK